MLLDALVARAAELEDVRVLHLHCEGPGPHLSPAMAGHFRHRALFIGPNARRAVNEGRAEYLPVFLSDIPNLFARGHLPLDAALINVSPPDAHGYCSLGTSVDVALHATRVAATVVYQSWGDAGQYAHNTTNWAVGAELGNQVPLRLGARGGRMPFSPAGAAPREWGASVGTGLRLAGGRGLIDMGLEHLQRRAVGLTERVWSFLLGITVRP